MLEKIYKNILIIKNYNKNVLSVVFILSLFAFGSCADTKKVMYFNVPDDTSLSNITMPEDMVIQKNDILTISITSLSPEAAAIYNPGNVLVNSDGTVQIPGLGSVAA